MMGNVQRHAATWATRAALALIAPFIAGVGAAGPIAAADFCVGDCNADGTVKVDEVITGVNIALGSELASVCARFDGNHDHAVTITELVAAVHNVLNGCPQREAFVIATDFETGSFATVTIDEPRTVTPASPARPVHSDAVARAFGGRVYVVNRFNGDSIQVLDPVHDFTTVSQCSTGNGSNPTDIAFVSATKAYVTRYALPQLLIVNPSAPADCTGFELGAVDLSSLADADGIPEMDQMVVVNGKLYVSLQRLNRNTFTPAERGALAVIDTATDQIAGMIELSGENPFGQTNGLTVRDGAIVVAEAGVLGTNDGGIERVDLAAGAAQGFFVSEADLGGDIGDFVLVSDRLGFAIISKPDFTNTLVAFDPLTRAVTQTLLPSANLSDIALNDRGELFVADRAVMRPGVRIFRADTGAELTSAPLDLGLPPFDIVFIP